MHDSHVMNNMHSAIQPIYIHYDSVSDYNNNNNAPQIKVNRSTQLL